MIPDVIQLVKIKGSFDLVVYAFAKDINQLFDLQKRISSLDGLAKIKINNIEILNIWPIPKQYISTF